jgi:pimeloyl-ACP methyl ester carboxylesterase
MNALSALQKSTIGRTAARFVERWAPAAGARVAQRLWFTVPAVPASNRNGTAARIGAPFTVTVGRAVVRGQTWGDGPNAYLVHGWGGWGGQLAGLVRPLVEAGYRVVAYDAPSHGESGPGALGPRRSTVVEQAETLAAVVDAQGPAAAVVAHSLGGAATALALRNGLKADRVVLLAPAADPTKYLRAFVRGLGFGPRVLDRTRELVERRAGITLDGLNVPRAALEADTPPLLVVHDRDDREVPWTDGAAIAEAWPESTLVTTTGLGHRRLLRDPLVAAEVASFLRLAVPATHTNE